LLLVGVGLLGVACGSNGVSAPPDPGVASPPADDQESGAASPADGEFVPSVWPEVVVAGQPTEVFVSVAPRDEVEGPVVYEVAGESGELEYEGGVHVASVDLTLTEDAELVVSAMVGGSVASGSATVCSVSRTACSEIMWVVSSRATLLNPTA
jgi:hypothetical protein